MSLAAHHMIFIGVDLGQRQSNTAFVVLERFDEVPEFTDALRGADYRRRFLVRQAERVALGTPYPVVVDKVKRVVANLSVKGPCALVVDGTGVGVPVIELMREMKVGCRILPIVITSGQTSTASSVPRAELLTKMQLMAQRGEIEIAANCRHIAQLKQELINLRLSGEQDDMAIALALACWRAKFR